MGALGACAMGLARIKALLAEASAGKAAASKAEQYERASRCKEAEEALVNLAANAKRLEVIKIEASRF